MSVLLALALLLVRFDNIEVYTAWTLPEQSHNNANKATRSALDLCKALFILDFHFLTRGQLESPSVKDASRQLRRNIQSPALVRVTRIMSPTCGKRAYTWY